MANIYALTPQVDKSDIVDFIATLDPTLFFSSPEVSPS